MTDVGAVTDRRKRPMWGVVVEQDFGPYRLLEILGEGGMGRVFRAYDTAHDREVALKVLAPNVAQDASFEQRFRHEAHVAAQLNEPHVVPIHSYGEINGQLYVDMRLIAGRDLASVLTESGPMNPVRAVGIVEQVADALDAAHAMNLIHRDIKPSNILLGRRDFVYLIDFGIAQSVNSTRLTRTGAAIGTFAYMAPERLDTGDAGPWSDTYSLACVLYECLTGQLPFPGDSIEQQIAGHLSKPPPRPSAVVASIPRTFDEVIARGMAKSARQRPPTVVALAEASRRALDPGPREAPPPVRPTQSAKTQVVATQRVLGPEAPWAQPPARGYPQAPIQRGPPQGGAPAQFAGMSPDQQSQGSKSFVAPGVLITIFAGLNIVVSLWDINQRHYDDDPAQWHRSLITLVLTLFSWPIFAVAFGLAARKGRVAGRAFATMSWLNCAAAFAGAWPWLCLLVERQTISTLVRAVPLLVFITLIGFGIAARQQFGWRCFLLASIAGGLGIVGFLLTPKGGEYGFLGGEILQLPTSPLAMTWLIPLLVLGIAMCRTRVGPRATN
jgi:serine/threonine protein kinase